jgi:hypothetical protein
MKKGGLWSNGDTALAIAPRNWVEGGGAHRHLFDTQRQNQDLN